MMNTHCLEQLVFFVQNEFGVSGAEIATALRHDESASHLPMVLWQYGFITIQQLEQLFDWLDSAKPSKVASCLSENSCNH